MSYIVCGWYTPDYRPWWDKLRPTIEAVGAEHDFVEVEPRTGSWETMTLRKALEVRKAISRNPGRTIIILDVDCVVNAPLNELASIPGDVGLCISGRADSKGRQKIRIRAGTIVVHPIPPALAFVNTWVQASLDAPPRSTDQTSLAMAMYQPNLTISVIGREWCAIPSDNLADPKILHTSASNALGLHGWRNWIRRAA